MVGIQRIDQHGPLCPARIDAVRESLREMIIDHKDTAIFGFGAFPFGNKEIGLVGGRQVGRSSACILFPGIDQWIDE